jgi:flagellar biosynthesis/type III secretory pathway protein FliH
MTFSSSALPPVAFVEQPLPGSSFAVTPVESRAGVAGAERSLDAAAEHARAEEVAYARGLRAGLEQAAAAQAERLRTALAALEGALGELRERERAQAAALAQAGLALALAAAKHVLRRELASDLDALASGLEEAFAALAPEAELVLALSPPDLALVAEGGAEALGRLTRSWNARLVSDPKLGAGEARAESSGAQVELVLDRVMERLEATLRERLAPPERTR